MTSPQHVLDEIRDLFRASGHEQYFGEKVTQFEHAAQAALLAKLSGADREVQTAAFLHDIGHLLPDETLEQVNQYGRKDHEEAAADWLRSRGFSEKIILLTENHVNAKRYLCYSNPAYYASLSDASKATLEFQGGRMTLEEAVIFENNPYFREIINLRLWDDEAKIEGREIPGLPYFISLCEDCLTSESAS